MTKNKQTVDAYMKAFAQSDHAAVLACLTEDIRWVMPGNYDLSGKAAFDKEIENPAFITQPDVRVFRMIEENDVVVAEGSVRTAKTDGTPVNAVFCDVFELRDAKVFKLTSYFVELKATAGAAP